MRFLARLLLAAALIAPHQALAFDPGKVPPVTLGTGSTGDVSNTSVTVNGTTQSLQSWLPTLAPLASPTFTGTAKMPTLSVTGTGSTGDVSGMTVTPTNGAAGTLGDLLSGKSSLNGMSLVAPTGSISNAIVAQGGANPAPILNKFPAFFKYVSNNQNALIGSVYSNRPAATLAFDTGITGYGQLDTVSAGNQVFGLFGRADCYAVGTCTNEVNAFNYSGTDAPTAYPWNRGIGTTSAVTVPLTVACGGNNKCAAGIEVAREGERPASFQYGMVMRNDANAFWNIWLDASSTSSAQNGIYSAIAGNGTNLLLQTKGTANPNNAVIRHIDANGTQTFAVDQAGDATGSGTATFGSVVATSGSNPSTRIANSSAGTDNKQWEWVVLSDGSFNLRADNDAYSAASVAMTGTRSGTTVNQWTIAAPTLTTSFTSTSDPTTTNIPAGRCADWNNTTAGTFKHVCNFGGTLRSIAMN